MLKAISVILSVTAASLPQLAFAADPDCDQHAWDITLANLQHTANTPGPNDRGCAEVRVHGGETAFDAFKHCNHNLRSDAVGGVAGDLGSPADAYAKCHDHAVDWFKAQNPPWSPTG